MIELIVDVKWCLQVWNPSPPYFGLFCLPNFLDCFLINSCKIILFLFLSNLFEETLILDFLFMRDRDLLVLQLILTPS